MSAAREQGLRIQEDVGIFGFDCLEICSMMNPPIPVVHQPEWEIGQIASQYLIDRIEGFTGPARNTKLKCTIVTK